MGLDSMKQIPSRTVRVCGWRCAGMRVDTHNDTGLCAWNAMREWR
jgi:hypothetical protein